MVGLSNDDAVPTKEVPAPMEQAEAPAPVEVSKKAEEEVPPSEDEKKEENDAPEVKPTNIEASTETPVKESVALEDFKAEEPTNESAKATMQRKRADPKCECRCFGGNIQGRCRGGRSQ